MHSYAEFLLSETPSVPQIARSHFIKAIENRINGLGISQPVVQIQGKNKTLVQCLEAEQRHRYH